MKMVRSFSKTIYPKDKQNNLSSELISLLFIYLWSQEVDKKWFKEGPDPQSKWIAPTSDVARDGLLENSHPCITQH